MKRTLPLSLMAVALLGLCVMSHASAILQVYGYGTSDSLITLTPGATAHLWVQTTLSADDDLATAMYRVVLPTATFAMAQRDYQSYNWYSHTDPDSGYLDRSKPYDDATFPIAITTPYYTKSSGDPSVPDFYFEDSQTGSNLITGNGLHPIEDFSLQLPSDLAPGDYAIAMADVLAYNGSLDQITGSAGSNFTLRVQSSGDVPEPGTTTLLGFGIAVLVGLRNRKWRH